MAKRPSKQYQKFADLTDRLLAVPRAELDEKLAEHKAKVDANPKRRGPKRKGEVTAPSDESVSLDAGGDAS